MKNFEANTTAIENENEEIRRFFDSQSNFLKGLVVFSVLQYVILIWII